MPEALEMIAHIKKGARLTYKKAGIVRRECRRCACNYGGGQEDDHRLLSPKPRGTLCVFTILIIDLNIQTETENIKLYS